VEKRVNLLGKEQQTLLIIQKWYKGPVEFFDDLQCFELISLSR